MGSRFLVLAALALCACDKAPSEPAAASSAVPSRPSAASLPSASATPEAEPRPKSPAEFQRHADKLAHKFIILDGHIDVPYRLEESKDAKGALTENVLERTKKGDFDLPRAKQGGLDAPFFSIYVPARYEKRGAKKLADSLIDLVGGIVEKSEGRMTIATNPAQIAQAFSAGKMAVLLGMENGSPVEGKLENLAHFFERGIRYITLAHSKDNHISDSSYDTRNTHKGLSPFGEKVVVEMARLGILVDVSHISDQAFDDVMRVSPVPVIASHSSCRHYTPGFQRNMSDEMIVTLAKKGGVIQINFGSDFIDGSIQKQNKGRYAELSKLLEKRKLDWSDKRAKAVKEEFWQKFEKKFAKIEQVADHIDHVKKLVGIDHVGLGSDFDGVGDSLPDGLKDVSQYPNLIRVLLERGYSDEDIEKLCAKNVLRVWTAVEKHAANEASKSSL
ncbi:MAG TPA: dipeptidase [Polyangiaceae bacterium]|nr:dipeptidase [Polyangiaceae bacterium]